MRYLLLLLIGLLAGCASRDRGDASDRKAYPTPVARTPSSQQAHVSMLDAKESDVGNYDKIFKSMVQQRWFGLLDNNASMRDRRGKVVLSFRLHYDGRITLLDFEENTVGHPLGLLCAKAILDQAPFPRWSTDMRQRVGVDYRDIRFTFHYE